MGRFLAKGWQNARNQILIALGWGPKDNRPQAGTWNLCVKRLSNERVHTEKGMVGYVTKDAPLNVQQGLVDADRSLWDFAGNGISDEQIEEGQLIYARYGKGDVKNMVQVTPHTLIDKAAHYAKTHLRRRGVVSLNLVDTSARMLESGWFDFSSGFAHTNTRFDVDCAETLFRIKINPLSCDHDDIRLLLFKEKSAKTSRVINEHMCRQRTEKSDGPPNLDPF